MSVFLIQQDEDDGAVAVAVATTPVRTAEAAPKTTLRVTPDSATKKPMSVFTNALGLVERTAKVKKNSSGTSNVAFGQNALQTPVKRGRGRPRKSPLTAVSAEIAAAKAAAAAAAKNESSAIAIGQAHNSANDVTVINATSGKDLLPKRPRGRPRKVPLPGGATTMTQLKAAQKSDADIKVTTDGAPLVSGDVLIHRVTTGKVGKKTRQRHKKTELSVAELDDLSNDPRRSGRPRKLPYKFAEFAEIGL